MQAFDDNGNYTMNEKEFSNALKFLFVMSCLETESQARPVQQEIQEQLPDDAQSPPQEPIRCGKCGADWINDESYCGQCGVAYAYFAPRCLACNAKHLYPGQSFCGECGDQFPAPSRPELTPLTTGGGPPGPLSDSSPPYM